MFKALATGCVAAAMVTVSVSNHARAAALFRAAEAHVRLYQNSNTHPVALGDDGLLVVEEYNTYNRGFIQNFLVDTQTGRSHRLDEAVGRPPRVMPGGLIGGSRFQALGQGMGIRYTFQGQSYLFQPEGPLGTAAGSTTSVNGGFVFNSTHVGLATGIGGLALRRLPTTNDPIGAIVATATLPSADPENGHPFADSINAAGRLAGTYYDDGTPGGLRPFVWQPDLTGNSSGAVVIPPIRWTYRGTEVSTTQSDHGDAVLINVLNNNVRAGNLYDAYLWMPGEGESSLVRLNDLFGRANVEVYDINSAGAMIGEVSDDDGVNPMSFLYTPETGLRAFTRDMIDVPVSADFISFRPRFINDLGQIGGSALYEQKLDNGSTIPLTKAVLLTAVPEPASMLAVGASLFALRVRRRG